MKLKDYVFVVGLSVLLGWALKDIYNSYNEKKVYTEEEIRSVREIACMIGRTSCLINRPIDCKDPYKID